MRKLMSYMVTPFEELGWAHALMWGTVLGFGLGTIVGWAFAQL